MRTTTLLLPLALALGPGCDAAAKGPIAEPFLESGKGDVGARVDDRGELTFAEARTGAFTEDLEFHGYRLSVGPGARVTLDNTHLGTAAKLDSTLYVYGPRGPAGFGTAALAFDDDSGWGRHARIRDLALPEAGEYLVVIGTADGRGRGHYRLQARCESDGCTPTPAPAACHPALAWGIQDCAAVQLADGDLEADLTLTYEEALGICSDGEAIGRIFDDACAAADAPAFCGLDFETFYTTEVPPCAAELGARTGLCADFLDQALALTVDGMLFTSESDHPYEVVRWPGAGAPSADAVRALAGLPADAPVETRTFDQLFAWPGRPDDPSMDDQERDDARRHRHLRRVLEANLSDTLVIRAGEVHIHVFLVGRTACGELAGVRTVAIET